MGNNKACEEHMYGQRFNVRSAYRLFNGSRSLKTSYKVVFDKKKLCSFSQNVLYIR